MKGLDGRGVLVTGGSRGIGEAVAERFLIEGSRVYICGLEPGEVEETTSLLNNRGEIAGTACDISVEEQVVQLVYKAQSFLGRIDVLINNAGVSSKEPFVKISAESWDRILAVNLRGVFLVGREVARRMVFDGRGGAIVNMASTNGLVGEENLAHYNASKGGVVLLTKSMALELGRHGIRVNALCPGYILTPLSKQLDSPESIETYAREKIPLGRVGLPDEVASAFAFLASDEASFIHGEALVIDGGQLSQ